MTSPVNILLVDDEVRNLDVLESFLESPDYRLIRALTGEEALLQLLNGVFAAIVLDIQMPGMTGIELANLIKQRKRTQHIPIIFLTAYYQDDKDVLQGYGLGAVDYLTKPLNPQVLKSKISVFADLFRKTRDLEAANAALEREILQRQRAEEALQTANNELEQRVRERTSDLLRVNQELSAREEALRASEAKALAASRAKDGFLAILSHELRTPLNPALLLATEGAANPALSAAVRADFESIARNVTLEARLIDDLLDLTRITHGKFALNLQPFDVHQGLQDALAIARRSIEQRGLALTVQLEAARHVVRGDEVRLTQVFCNILLNAAKFTPAGGRITVVTADDNRNMLIVRVTDTGIGMTAAELGRIFEAFCQGDHAAPGEPHRFGGMGLGLAIARKMMDLHGGSITASSEGRDHGATIAIELPLCAALAREPLTVPPLALLPPKPTASGKIRRILLVEDHAATAQALTQLLTHRHYEVRAAASLAEARKMAALERCELLISDIGLPDGSGYDLMRELGPRGWVGIALTGYGRQEDVEQSREAGFLTQLTKPVTIQALEFALAKVNHHLAHPEPPPTNLVALTAFIPTLERRAE